MSRPKGKARKGKRTTRPQATDVRTESVVEGLAAARVHAHLDGEPTRVVVNPVVAASAERFVANPELTPPPAFEDKDDMGDYLGEIFYARPQPGNDIALDMETLQPVGSALAPIVMGAVMAAPRVRDLMAEFEDAPTLPETLPYQPPAYGDQPPLQLAAYEEEPLRSARVSGR